MKNLVVILLVFGSVFGIGLGLKKIDTSFQTVNHSYKTSVMKNEQYEIKSPQYYQYKFLRDNHWVFSPIYSQLEDVFYPFRIWNKNPSDAVVYKNKYAWHQSQVKSLKKSENATKVRALRSYFLAERKNFKNSSLNKEYELKRQQWLTNYYNLLVKKTSLLNGNYDNRLIILFGALIFIACGIFGFKGSVIDVLLKIGVLFLSLLIASFGLVSSNAIAFYWILLFLILGMNYRKTPLEIYLNTYLKLTLILIIFFGVAGYSLAIFEMGFLVFFLLISFPKLKELIRPLLVIHPIGLITLFLNRAVVLNKQLFAGLILIIGSVIFGMSFFQGLTLSFPMSYAPEWIQILNAICLMTGAAYLFDEQMIQNASISKVTVLLIVFIGSIYLFMVDTLIKQWMFYFIVNPIILWGSVIIFLFSIREKNTI